MNPLNHGMRVAWVVMVGLLMSSSVDAADVPSTRKVEKHTLSAIESAKKAAKAADKTFAAVDKMREEAGPRPAPVMGYPTLNVAEARRMNAIAYRSAAFHYGHLATVSAKMAELATDEAVKAEYREKSQTLMKAARVMWAMGEREANDE